MTSDATEDGKARYALVIETRPDETDPGAIRQLRALLKAIGRRFGFRVVTCTPATRTRER